MADSHPHSPQILFDALNCMEEKMDDNVDSVLHSTRSVKCRREDGPIRPSSNRTRLLEFFEQDLREDEELFYLLNKEQENEPCGGFEEDSSLSKARCEVVEWMLKVIGYYSFSALTAVRAINYLDRFMYSFKSHGEKKMKKPWMNQLAAVACISLAAKVEETRVPLLLDIQVEEPNYVFDSKTIQRMEILILSTLEWKMYPITPLNFLDYIGTRLKFKNHRICMEFAQRCECLVLSVVVTDCRFLCYLPSALATAVMVYVISSLEPCIAVEYQDQLMGILGINKDKVLDCCKLIQEVATTSADDDDDYHSNKKRKYNNNGPGSGSPKAVLDVLSFSSDCCSWGPSPNASVTSSPDSFSKKIKNAIL